jgi:hypothetical protein
MLNTDKEKTYKMNKIKTIAKGCAATVFSAALPAVSTFAVGKAKSGLDSVNPNADKNVTLESQIQLILNAVYVVIGMVAVIMIILGGVSYATSQGDAAKVKKGKDTILYGIIGLIVVLLAFAITNFVLTQLGA